MIPPTPYNTARSRPRAESREAAFSALHTHSVVYIYIYTFSFCLSRMYIAVSFVASFSLIRPPAYVSYVYTRGLCPSPHPFPSLSLLYLYKRRCVSPFFLSSSCIYTISRSAAAAFYIREMDSRAGFSLLSLSLGFRASLRACSARMGDRERGTTAAAGYRVRSWIFSRGFEKEREKEKSCEVSIKSMLLPVGTTERKSIRSRECS